MKNTLRFIDDSANQSDLEINIKYFNAINAHNLDLDESFFNRKMFAQTIDLDIKGYLNSIQADLFKDFPNLKRITLLSTSTIRLIRRQGIDWIKGINHQVNVNLSN